jgi:hypothetical protein
VDAIRQIGVSEVTYYRWRQEFGGLKTEQVKRLKDLELENSRLRKAVSDLTPVRRSGSIALRYADRAVKAADGTAMRIAPSLPRFRRKPVPNPCTGALRVRCKPQVMSYPRSIGCLRRIECQEARCRP